MRRRELAINAVAIGVLIVILVAVPAVAAVSGGMAHATAWLVFLAAAVVVLGVGVALVIWIRSGPEDPPVSRR